MAEADIAITTQEAVEVETLFEEDSQGSNLEVLEVSTVFELSSLPPKLRRLKIEGCKSLEALPDDLFRGITTLKKLYLIDCSSLRSFPYPGSLTSLYIRNCRRLEFPPSPESNEQLAHLSIGSSYDSLSSWNLSLFPQLRTFCIWDCPNLLSIDGGRAVSLESLEIRDCPIFRSFPAEGLHAPNLGSISLFNCKNLKELPKAMNSLTSLKALFLHRCPEIESFPSGGLPCSLFILSMAYCDKLVPQKDWGLQSLDSLDRFELEGGCVGMESFPGEESLPCNINTVRISSLKSLKKLDYDGFQHLNALRTLEIRRCEMLRSLPDEGFPSSLDRLCVVECPLLTPRLKPWRGDEWNKVARIPHIQIDGQALS